jgi:hypothetical protein
MLSLAGLEQKRAEHPLGRESAEEHMPAAQAPAQARAPKTSTKKVLRWKVLREKQ